MGRPWCPVPPSFLTPFHEGHLKHLLIAKVRQIITHFILVCFKKQINRPVET